MGAEKKKESNQKSNSYFFAFLASIVGCIVGIIAVKYLRDYDYKSVGPIGLFCGLFSLIFIRKRTNLFGIWCLILAFFVSVRTEFIMFSSKQTLNEFLQNWQNISPKSMASILFGTFVAFYFGRGKKES